MIKIFLKHLIYEKCINVLFNAISRNFTRPPCNITLSDAEELLEEANNLIRGHYTIPDQLVGPYNRLYTCVRVGIWNYKVKDFYHFYHDLDREMARFVDRIHNQS